MPFNNQGEARDAINALFNAAWIAQASPPPLLYDDVEPPDDGPKVPDGRTPFARIIVRHNIASQATLGEEGNRRFRRFGIVTVQIFSISGKGLTTNDQFVTIAVDAFEGKSTGADEVEFKNVTPKEIGRDGNYFQTNVIAEFEYDVIK